MVMMIHIDNYHVDSRGKENYEDDDHDNQWCCPMPIIYSCKEIVVRMMIMTMVYIVNNEVDDDDDDNLDDRNDNHDDNAAMLHKERV